MCLNSLSLTCAKFHQGMNSNNFITGNELTSIHYTLHVLKICDEIDIAKILNQQYDLVEK